MPPKKSQGARRRGTTLPLNDFLRSDEDKIAPKPKGTETNPPMVKNRSSRSRNKTSRTRELESSRSCNKTSKYNDEKTNPPKPTDTNPPMPTNGSRRSGNSTRMTDDKSSAPSDGSNRPSTPALKSIQQSTSALGSVRSGNSTSTKYDEELDPQKPTNTDIKSPIATNDTLKPSTSGVASRGCDNNDDRQSTYSAVAGAANRQELTAPITVWVSANQESYQPQGGAPIGNSNIQQLPGMGLTSNIEQLAAPLAPLAPLAPQAVVGLLDPSQYLAMSLLNRPPTRRGRGRRNRNRRRVRREGAPPMQALFLPESIRHLMPIPFGPIPQQQYFNVQQQLYNGNFVQPQPIFTTQPQSQPQSLLDLPYYNVQQESYNGHSLQPQFTINPQYLNVQEQAYHGGIGYAGQQQIGAISCHGHQQIPNTQARTYRIDRGATLPIQPRDRPQALEPCKWEGTRISMRRRIQRRRRLQASQETVEMENAFAEPSAPEPLYCNCNFQDIAPSSISDKYSGPVSFSASHSPSFIAVPADENIIQMGRSKKMPVQMLIPPGRIDIPADISTSMVLYNPETGAIAARLDSEPLPLALQNNNCNASQSVFRMASLPITGVGTDGDGAGSTYWVKCSPPLSRCGHAQDWPCLSSWCHTLMATSFRTGPFQEKLSPFSQHQAQSLLQIRINIILQNPVLDFTIRCQDKMAEMLTPYRFRLHKNELFPFSRGSPAQSRNSFACRHMLQVQDQEQQMASQMVDELSFNRSSIQTFQNTYHCPMSWLTLVDIDLEETKTTNRKPIKKAMPTSIFLSDVQGNKSVLRAATNSISIWSTGAQGPPLLTNPISIMPTCVPLIIYELIYAQCTASIISAHVTSFLLPKYSKILPSGSDQLSTQTHLLANQFAEPSAKLAMRLEVL